MSAPAENAFSPSPVKMITLTSSLWFSSSKVLISSFATSVFIALSLSGLLILTVQMPSEVDVVTSDMEICQVMRDLNVIYFLEIFPH